MKKFFLVTAVVLVAGLSGCAQQEKAIGHTEPFFETLKVAPAAEGLDDMVYHLKDKRTQKCYYYIDGFKTATFEEVEC